MNNSKMFFALFLFFFATFAEGASIYKWVDEQGVTHYSAATPTDKKALRLTTQPAPPAVESTSQQPSMRDWQANEDLKNHKEKRDQLEADANRLKTEKANQCAIAKQRLGVLQQQIRLYRTNAQGEREYWDDDAREAETRKMKEVEANNC